MIFFIRDTIHPPRHQVSLTTLEDGGSSLDTYKAGLSGLLSPPPEERRDYCWEAFSDGGEIVAGGTTRREEWLQGREIRNRIEEQLFRLIR